MAVNPSNWQWFQVNDSELKKMLMKENSSKWYGTKVDDSKPK